MTRTDQTYNFSEFSIPDYMQNGLVLWIEKHVPPGGFLQAVLCNDLSMAVALADDTNIRVLPGYARFLYNEAPSNCHGSVEKVLQWCHPDCTGMLEYFIRQWCHPDKVSPCDNRRI